MIRPLRENGESKARAQDIVDQILASDRYVNASTFSDRVFHDEPILRTGAQAFPRETRRRMGHKRRVAMPERYAKMRALEKGKKRSAGTNSSAHLFYEQAKLMEDFTDNYSGTCEYSDFIPTYARMNDRQIRCYFTWRTKLRKGNPTYVSTSFLYVYASEILCGIGVEPGEAGLAELARLRAQYAGVSDAFDWQLARWMHDYVIYHGLDPTLYDRFSDDPLVRAASVMLRAQRTLLSLPGKVRWPDQEVEGLPAAADLMDAMGLASRYDLARSRFARENREDIAYVCAHVFARMVDHCHKRRRVDYVEGMFGEETYAAYAMFPSAVFWSPTPHEDVDYQASESEHYICENGFWYRVYPIHRMISNKELGALVHAVDTRMRERADYPHKLKPRKLTKYQGKYIDEEIEALYALREAQEKARIRIDWSSLGGIRSASERTREALLTDEERGEDVEAVPAETAAPAHETEKIAPLDPEPVEDAAPTTEPTNQPASQPNALGLTDEQVRLLRVLLDGDPVPNEGFVSLAVDAINDAFLDIIGDTIIDYDGEVPCLVEDYVEDVRAEIHG